MIADVAVGGVLVPGLLALAALALALTLLVLRLLHATPIARRLPARPLIELALFLIIFGLLTETLATGGYRL